MGFSWGKSESSLEGFDLDVTDPEDLSVVLDGDLSLGGQFLLFRLLLGEVEVLHEFAVEGDLEFVLFEFNGHAIPFAVGEAGIFERTIGADHACHVVVTELALLAVAIEDNPLSPQ